MTEKEILTHINDGANYYISMFGKAEHMETIHKEFYSYVQPKENQQGISIIYNVHIDKLPHEKQKELVAEMKALSMPIWLDLLAPDEVFSMIFGKGKVHGQTMFADDDEVYMALLPHEKTASAVSAEKIVKVQSPEEFAVWTKIANDILANGYPHMHPIYHYPLCRDGFLKCYILYHQGIPASVASIMDNNGIASLEFVATIPEMRRQGLARAVCEMAVEEAFWDGAEIVTLRAIDAVAGKLYHTMGFRAYNYVI